MTSEHLSDEDIQEYVLGGLNSEHIQACAICQEKADAYQLLITAIEQEPVPVPDFDISELVMARIETKKSRHGWIYISMMISLFIPGAFIYIFREEIAMLFYGISTLLIYLIAITGISILIAMMADQFNTYKNKLQQINQQPVS